MHRERSPAIHYPLTRRRIVGALGADLVGLGGCSMLASSEQPPDGAVAVENDTRETHTAAVTVSDALGEMLLNRTFDVVGGGLVATDPVIQRQGTCAIRAVVGDTSREAEVTFEREGPDGEKVYGYILIFFDDPPIEITIEGPPIGTDSP